MPHHRRDAGDAGTVTDYNDARDLRDLRHGACHKPCAALSPGEDEINAYRS